MKQSSSLFRAVTPEQESLYRFNEQLSILKPINSTTAIELTELRDEVKRTTKLTKENDPIYNSAIRMCIELIGGGIETLLLTLK